MERKVKDMDNDYVNENDSNSAFFDSRYARPISRLLDAGEISEELAEDATEWLRKVVRPFHKESPLLFVDERGTLNVWWNSEARQATTMFQFYLNTAGAFVALIRVDTWAKDFILDLQNFTERQESAEQIFRRFVAPPYDATKDTRR